MANYNKFTDSLTAYIEYETTVRIGMPIKDISCRYCPFYKRNMDGQYECNNPNVDTNFIPYLPKDVKGMPYWCPLVEVEVEDGK